MNIETMAMNVGNLILVSGWWFQPTPLKNMLVSWDGFANIWNKKNVPNHQPGSHVEMGICHGIHHQGTGSEATSKHTTFRTTLAAPPWQNATDVFTDINGLFMINMASQWLIISS